MLSIYDNESDIVIAESPEDASRLLFEDGMVDEVVDAKTRKWRRISADADYKFHDDESGAPATIRKASEWVALKGRGFMGSYDF